MASLVLDDCISADDLQKFKDEYKKIEKPSFDKAFQFGLCLIRSKESSDIKQGMKIFKCIFDDPSSDEDIKRDSLYYMAVGEAKLKNYEPALKYLQAILTVQTGNDQVKDLYEEVNRRMKKDGLIGLGIIGGAATFGIVGLIGLGAALLARK